MSKQRGPRTTFVGREKSIRGLVRRIWPKSAKSDKSNFNNHKGFSGIHLSFTPPPGTICALLNRGWHRAYARLAQTPAVPPRKNFLRCWVSRARSVWECKQRRNVGSGSNAPCSPELSTGVDNSGDNRGVAMSGRAKHWLA